MHKEQKKMCNKTILSVTVCYVLQMQKKADSSQRANTEGQTHESQRWKDEEREWEHMKRI